MMHFGYLATSSSLIVITFVQCLQEVPEKSKESLGSPWQFVGLLPLFDPPRHDSAETIRRALNLGVNVKMITGNSTHLFSHLQSIHHFLVCHLPELHSNV